MKRLQSACFDVPVNGESVKVEKAGEFRRREATI